MCGLMSFGQKTFWWQTIDSQLHKYSCLTKIFNWGFNKIWLFSNWNFWYRRYLVLTLHCPIKCGKLNLHLFLRSCWCVVEHLLVKNHFASRQWDSVTHQMAVPVPSISCCVLNHHNLVYQIQDALAFYPDTCCNLALFLWMLPFHCLTKRQVFIFDLKVLFKVFTKFVAFQILSSHSSLPNQMRKIESSSFSSLLLMCGPMSFGLKPFCQQTIFWQGDKYSYLT
jgi:hypothetical protein